MQNGYTCIIDVANWIEHPQSLRHWVQTILLEWPNSKGQLPVKDLSKQYKRSGTQQTTNSYWTTWNKNCIVHYCTILQYAWRLQEYTHASTNVILNCISFLPWRSSSVDRVENSTLAAHNSQSFLLEMIWVAFRPQAQRGILQREILHQLHWAHLFLLDACHIGHGASLQSPILCKKATRREIKLLVKKAHRRASRNPQCLLYTKNLNLSNFSPEKSTCDRCVRAIYCLHHKLITQISSNWFPIGAGIPGKSTVTKKHTQWILQNHHEIPWNQYFLGLRPSMKNHRNIRLASEMVSQ